MAQGTLEERVAYLEGKVEEQSRGYRELREDVQQLAARVDAMDQRLSARMDALDQKVERFREELSGRMEAMDQRLSARIDALDQKVERFREELSGRIDALDQKVERFRMWTVGIQVAVLLAVVGALAAALFRG